MLLLRMISLAALAMVALLLGGAAPAAAQESPETILLKDYSPKSIYKIPVTQVPKAKYPVIDMHSHSYAKTPEQIAEWVKNMDEAGIERTIVLTGASGSRFDEVYKQYSRYPGRFELWCGFDFTGSGEPGFGPAAVKELERCYRAGARGVGELIDKGRGMGSRRSGSPGIHPDDARMDPLFHKCAELGMPVNIHVADPIWMYEKMDQTNDGLMNAYRWRLDNRTDIVGHSGMVEILERMVKRHPKTTFIACHFANLCYDLTRLGAMLDRNPNLHADISARFAETAAIPRFVSRFYANYQNRLVYGTDMGYNTAMYRITFRVLETLDEHFYETRQFGYHWSMNGLGLPDSVLKKIYRENALKILGSKRRSR